MKNTSAKRALWRGLTSTTASLLALTIAATPLVNGFRTDIDKFLGTKSQMIVTDSEKTPAACILTPRITPAPPSWCRPLRIWVNG